VHLAKECSGNLHDHSVADVRCAPFAKKSQEDDWRGKKAADLEAVSNFASAYRDKEEEYISHTGNNWTSQDFSEKRIVPSHYPFQDGHLKAWLVEASAHCASLTGNRHEDDCRIARRAVTVAQSGDLPA
jgi:hypothetical protein